MVTAGAIQFSLLPAANLSERHPSLRCFQAVTFAIRNGALDTNRTCDPPLRRGMLYPLSYEGVYRTI